MFHFNGSGCYEKKASEGKTFIPNSCKSDMLFFCSQSQANQVLLGRGLGFYFVSVHEINDNT